MQSRFAARRQAVEQKPWEVDKRWPDPACLKNRVITAEITEKYGGMYVAWSRDGTRIVEGDASEAELYKKIKEAGIDLLDVVIDYIDRPGEANW
jgi:hypothetical protein